METMMNMNDETEKTEAGDLGAKDGKLQPGPLPSSEQFAYVCTRSPMKSGQVSISLWYVLQDLSTGSGWVVDAWDGLSGSRSAFDDAGTTWLCHHSKTIPLDKGKTGPGLNRCTLLPLPVPVHRP